MRKNVGYNDILYDPRIAEYVDARSIIELNATSYDLIINGLQNHLLAMEQNQKRDWRLMEEQKLLLAESQAQTQKALAEVQTKVGLMTLIEKGKMEEQKQLLAESQAQTQKALAEVQTKVGLMTLIEKGKMEIAELVSAIATANQMNAMLTQEINRLLARQRLMIGASILLLLIIAGMLIYWLLIP